MRSCLANRNNENYEISSLEYEKRIIKKCLYLK